MHFFSIHNDPVHVPTIQTVVIVRTPPVRPAARTDNYNIGIAAVHITIWYYIVILIYVCSRIDRKLPTIFEIVSKAYNI